MSIIIAMLIFSVIVIFHELGHFLLARLNGVEVTEFSLGMGPRIITVCKSDEGMRVKFFASTRQCEEAKGWAGHTMYSVKILPFGGSCIMLGEDDVVDAENAFCKKSVYARMSIVFAGPFFNFILAFILAIIITAVAGVDKPVITSVESGMPMALAGVKAGDEIVEINGSSINIDREISTYFTFNPISEGDELDIVLKRGDETYSVKVSPVLATAETVIDGVAVGAMDKKEEPVKTYRYGFGYGSPRQKCDAVSVLKYSAYEVKYWIVTTVKSLGMLVTGNIGKDDISGPVGIVSAVGSMVDESSNYGISSVLLTLISFSILLSANLGVMNLLPIPALDGGRLFFQIIEVIRRKPIAPEKEGIITMIGFVLLMALMIFVMYNDIMKLIVG
ncbi:MAG: RIP metalloprotease [Lachnospiraceae bacterium]|nr:RIP metalloprotease [Lachnospiraceae bacterium]